jgi:TATA-box binding protein (TBP) (component of TFIID and TFIIIB)
VLDSKGKVVYTGVGEDQDIEAALKKAVEGGRRRSRAVKGG